MQRSTPGGFCGRPEQSRIPGFAQLSWPRRRQEVAKHRKGYLLQVQQSGNQALYRRAKKNYRSTDPYTHLAYDERRRFIADVAETVSKWGFARLFAECIDKVHFDPVVTGLSPEQQAFEQVVSRFEKYLQIISQPQDTCYGLLIHDNNETVERKHTELMKDFLRRGTLWTTVTNTIETPLFVNSELTSMVQVADLCAYALRRYLENGERELFQLVFERADRKDGVAVGVRHYTDPSCSCLICAGHRQ